MVNDLLEHLGLYGGEVQLGPPEHGELTGLFHLAPAQINELLRQAALNEGPVKLWDAVLRLLDLDREIRTEPARRPRG